MLVFIVPVKSKYVSTSWETVSKLFERCVKSICNQTINDFRVIVVCNEKPEIEFSHPHITYIEHNFELQGKDWKSKQLDKLSKFTTGLIYARQLNPSHVMCVDADDCVSKYLAEFVNSKPQANGWFIKKGYIYNEGSKLIRVMRKGFDQYCGTSNIIRYDLYNVPEMVSAIYDKEYTQYIFNSYRHRDITSTLAKKGTPLEPLPFPGAVYIKNGENVYFGVANKNKALPLKSRLLRMKALLDYRWLVQSTHEEFSLYKINNISQFA
ncbi:MAG: glycosyltransferase family 2 protein [Komarekiella atlantica HA4396-MV6]|jgi:hypothetical protein|nr:glycosyltransferase family 2 protein [Komarekiella atlantica HA4396-MV6]